MAYKFLMTIGGRKTAINEIQSTSDVAMKCKNIPDYNRIKKIEKIFNPTILERFEREALRMTTKNAGSIKPLDLIRHMFHGTN